MLWNYYFPIALSGFVKILFAELLYARKLPRRNLWWIWVPIAVAAGAGVLILYSYVESVLFADREESVNLFAVFTQQLLLLAASAAAVCAYIKASPATVFLCFLSAVATSRIVSDVYGVLEAIGLLRFDWIVFDGSSMSFAWVQTCNWLIFYIIHLSLTAGVYCIFGRINNQNKVGNKYLLWMSFCMLFICLIADSVISVYLRVGGIVVITLRLVLVMCSLFVLMLRDEVQRSSAAKTELELAERIIEQQARQYEQSAKNVELINIKCHDLRKQIRGIAQIRAVDPEEIAKIVRIYDSSVKTGNDTLDVILGGYGLRCAAEKIELSCMIDGSKFSAFAVSDVYALFGNLLDNALEYLSSVPEQDKRFVRIASAVRGDYYILTAENYFEGDVSFDGKGIPNTHKVDKQNHGYGTRSIKYIAEKYGGFADFEVDCNLFIVRCAFPLDKLKTC